MARYRLTKEEADDLASLLDFYLNTTKKQYGFLADSNKDVMLKRQIKGKLIGLTGRVFYQQVDDLKLPFISLSKYSIKEFIQNYESFLLHEAKSVPGHARKKNCFLQLKKSLNPKLETEEFIVKQDGSTKKPREKKEINPRFFKSFANSSWYLYEVSGAKLVRRILQFERAIDRETYLVKLNAYHKLSPWTGQAKFWEEQQIITFVLTNAATHKNYTHIILEIDSRADKFCLGVGHLTFNGDNNNNIVTKFIALHKIEHSFDKPEQNEQEYPKEITSLFDDVKRPQLMFSHDLTIFDLNSLDDILSRKPDPDKQ